MNTPLQQAAQAVIDRWNLPAFTNAGDIAALEKALEAEQAQAVEPIKISWKNLALWYEAGATDWNDLRGVVTEMLHAHPAPPATGERYELMGRLSFTAAASAALKPMCLAAMHMLEADASRITELEELSVTNILLDVVPGDGSGLEIFAKSTSDVVDLLTKMSEKIEDFESSKHAQQVAVPSGWALVPIEPTEEMIAAGRATPCTDEEDMDDDYRAVYKAMLAAARKDKP